MHLPRKLISFFIFFLLSTVAFVSMGAFMTVIADPLIGGTYMTVRTKFSIMDIEHMVTHSYRLTIDMRHISLSHSY